MKRRNLVKSLLASAVFAGCLSVAAGGALAQEVTLRLHQFLPETANVPQYVLQAWIDQVEEASDGRIEVEMYSSMALGGTPPSLIDQARDGVVDIVWTLPGLTPGRFPQAEVFELPFIATDAEPTSRAHWELFEEVMEERDFKDFKILGAWVHGPGLIHGGNVRSLEDMQGLKLRTPTGMITQLLDEIGAAPIGMPVPALPEALSKGVIDAAVTTWEVAPTLRLAELVDTNTVFSGDHAFYVATFVLAMNQQKFDSLPEDLQQIIGENSGMEFSAMAGRVMQEWDGPGREAAIEQGNEIIELDQEEVARWVEASQPVIDNWIAEMDANGYDGQMLYDRARELIEEHTN